MSSVIDICNVALSILGSDAIVTSIDPPDGSAEAGHCARFYPIALNELVDWHPWSFAKKRQELAEVTNVSNVWAYAYQLPSDCVTPLRVLQTVSLTDFGTAWLTGQGVYTTADELALFTERGSADFEIEGGVLYTHEPQAVLLYSTRVEDTTRYSPLLDVALGYLLASFLAGPLIKGREGAQTGATLRQAVFGPSGRGGGLADRAAANDANGSSERAAHTPEHIRVRS